MKNIFSLLLISSFVSLFSTAGFSQVNPQDLTVKVNKASKKIEIIKKSDASNVTSAFRLNMCNIDVFDRGGKYAGTVELKEWAIPLDEFSPDETAKISKISVTEIKSGKTIELKDIRLDL